MTPQIRWRGLAESWSVSCLDLPGCHSQGESREEAGVKHVETLELAVLMPRLLICCAGRPEAAAADGGQRANSDCGPVARHQRGISGMGPRWGSCHRFQHDHPYPLPQRTLS